MICVPHLQITHACIHVSNQWHCIPQKEASWLPWMPCHRIRMKRGTSFRTCQLVVNIRLAPPVVTELLLLYSTPLLSTSPPTRSLSAFCSQLPNSTEEVFGARCHTVQTGPKYLICIVGRLDASCEGQSSHLLVNCKWLSAPLPTKCANPQEVPLNCCTSALNMFLRCLALAILLMGVATIGLGVTSSCLVRAQPF
jgi:hypothetical protein